MPRAADINTLIDNASADMDAGSYAAARIKLMRAKALMVSVGRSGIDGSTFEYTAGDLDSLIKQCAELGRAATGIKKSKIKWVNAGASDEC